MVKYILLFLLIPAIAFGVELDTDSNGAIDVDKGGTNAQNAAGIRSAINVEDGAEANEPLVSQAVAEAGTSETEYSWSPLRIAQAIAALASSTSSFLGLSDTPSAYTGQGGKAVMVKADETGLEFTDVGGGGIEETDPAFLLWLSTTPPVMAESDPFFTEWLSTFVDSVGPTYSFGTGLSEVDGHVICTVTQYSDADIDGNESAFTGWDKNASDDLAWDYDFGDLINVPEYLLIEVDGSTTNEINTITVDAGGTTIGLALTLTGSGIIATSRSGDTITIAGTEVDQIIKSLYDVGTMLYADEDNLPVAKTAAQMETILAIDDLVTLSGRARGAYNFGTVFIGTTIGDNRTVKQALQDLETAVEGKQAAGSYEPADSTILKDADIGVTVLASTGDGSGLTNLYSNTSINAVYRPVRNISGSTIAAGKWVYSTGGNSQRITIGLADNTAYATSHVIGYVPAAISNNANGYIIVKGHATAQNTNSFTDGNELYLGTSGDAVTSKPTNAIAVPVGEVAYASPAAGVVEVSIHYPLIGVDEAYDPTGWDGDIGSATKDAIRDKINGLAPADIGAEPAKGADDNYATDAEKTELAKRYPSIVLFRSDQAVTVTTGTTGIPIAVSGYNIVDVVVNVDDKGVTGTTNVQVRRRRAGSEVNVCSTEVTLGDEWYAHDGVINTANDDLQIGDILYIDVTAVHSGTPPNGLSVAIVIQLTP